MSKVSEVRFVSLDGDPPEGETLDGLPVAEAVAKIVRLAFEPFMSQGGAGAGSEGEALVVVYAYGHAWLKGGVAETSIRVDGASIALDGPALMSRLIPAGASDRAIIILDCCHAGAFEVPEPAPRLVVYGSAGEEKAIALTGERASRLSLAFARALSGAEKTVDFLSVVGSIAKALDEDSVLRGQSVSYRMNGKSIRLDRGAQGKTGGRERTVSVIRNVLLGVGALAATLAIAAT